MRTIFIPQGCVLTLVRGETLTSQNHTPLPPLQLDLISVKQRPVPAIVQQLKLREKRIEEIKISICLLNAWVHRKWSLPSSSKCFVAWRDSGRKLQRRRDIFSFFKVVFTSAEVLHHSLTPHLMFPPEVLATGDKMKLTIMLNEITDFSELKNVGKFWDNVRTQRNKKSSKDLVVLSQKWYVLYLIPISSPLTERGLVLPPDVVKTSEDGSHKIVLVLITLCPSPSHAYILFPPPITLLESRHPGWQIAHTWLHVKKHVSRIILMCIHIYIPWM